MTGGPTRPVKVGRALARPANPSIQLEMKRILPVFERAEQVRDIGMFNRDAGVIGHKVLFADIGDIVALIVLGQKVIKRLILDRTAFFGDRRIPLIGICEFWIDIENDPSKRVFLVPDHLSEIIFRARFQHNIAAPNG